MSVSISPILRLLTCHLFVLKWARSIVSTAWSCFSLLDPSIVLLTLPNHSYLEEKRGEKEEGHVPSATIRVGGNNWLGPRGRRLTVSAISGLLRQ